MNTPDAVDRIRLALTSHYARSLAWTDYDLDEGTITIEWVSEGVTKIKVTT